MNVRGKKVDYAQQVIEFAKYYAKIFEDLSVGILGFIPDGLEQIYDQGLKRLPLLKKIFGRRWVEQAIKLICGITIGQGLATDIGRYVFWPLGFCIGALMGMGMARYRVAPSFPVSIKKFFYGLSVWTVSGACCGALTWPFYSVFIVISIMGWGALLGTILCGIYYIVLYVIQLKQIEKFYQMAQAAKELGIKLKEHIRQNAKGRILVFSQDIIQQVNGSEASLDMAAFFEKELDAITQPTNIKIDRHVKYLIEKASYGNIDALARLRSLVNKKSERDKLLDRLFNTRAIAKIKDEVDTRYDRWHYQYLL